MSNLAENTPFSKSQPENRPIISIGDDQFTALRLLCLYRRKFEEALTEAIRCWKPDEYRYGEWLRLRGLLDLLKQLGTTDAPEPALPDEIVAAGLLPSSSNSFSFPVNLEVLPLLQSQLQSPDFYFKLEQLMEQGASIDDALKYFLLGFDRPLVSDSHYQEMLELNEDLRSFFRAVSQEVPSDHSIAQNDAGYGGA